ncbi:MAG: monooxygenase [Pseudomonadota bacterium]|nr:monooxygenase [Pseudomonadota bacterium]
MILLLAACADPLYPVCEEEPPVGTRADTPTWHAEVRALVEANCAACHTALGLAPVPLDDYASAAAYAGAMATAVATRAMPPWPPADCCTPLQHSPSLSPEEIATFQAWAAGGAPEGDPADYVAPAAQEDGLSHVDLSIVMAEPYTPAPPDGTSDDTRCFLLDWPETEPRYVTGLGVRPGVASQVHHALLLTVAPVNVPLFEATDALAPGPGWSCPGGVVLGATGWIGGWSPGWTARELPEGTGQFVEPGSKLLLTVHYSTPEGDVAPDATTVDLQLADEVDHTLTALPVYDPAWLLGDFSIPAGEPDVVETYHGYFGGAWMLLGVNLHMHERGKSGNVGILHADGTSECLLQIDDWDHGWQGDYLFETPVRLAWDDQLYVECHWDNTEGNQRLVDGVREAPRDLVWAEDEEMCVAFVTVISPL